MKYGLIIILMLNSLAAQAQTEVFDESLDSCLQKLAQKAPDVSLVCDQSLRDLTKSPFTEQTNQLYLELVQKLKDQNVKLTDVRWDQLQASMSGAPSKSPTLLEKRELSSLLKELNQQKAGVSLLKNGKPVPMDTLPKEANTVAQWSLTSEGQAPTTQVEPLNAFLQTSLKNLNASPAAPVQTSTAEITDRPKWVMPVLVVGGLLLGAYLLKDKQVTITY